MHNVFDSIIFDFDSTLIVGESLDWLGEIKGMGQKIAELTAKAMNGESPLESVMEYKMNLMSPNQKDLESIIAQAKQAFTPGVKELLERLRAANKNIYILTSNFHQIIDPLAAELGVGKECVVANDLLFKADGSYAGVAPHSPLMKENSKAEILKSKASAWGRRIFIGDSVSDAKAIPYIERFVGYGGVVTRPKAKALCEFFVEDKNLLALLPYLLNESEIRNLTTTTTGTRPSAW